MGSFRGSTASLSHGGIVDDLVYKEGGISVFYHMKRYDDSDDISEYQRTLVKKMHSMVTGTPTQIVNKIAKVKRKISSADDIAFLPYDGTNIVVADREKGVVRVFDESGKYERTLARNVTPLGVCTNRSGTVALSNVRGDNTVQIWSQDGTRIAMWGDEWKWKPRGVCFTNKGLLVVTNSYQQQDSCGIYTLEGKQILTFGNQGTGNYSFHDPYYVHVDMYDRILVSDRQNHCIKVYTDSGRYLGRCGHKGHRNGELYFPRGVCSDNHGNILVCDTGNRRVTLFSPSGEFIKNYLTRSHDAIAYPYSIAFSRSEQKLAVAQHSSTEGSFHKLRIYSVE